MTRHRARLVASTLLATVALTVPLAVSACSSSSAPSGSSSSPASQAQALEGKVWKATQIAGAPSVLTDKGVQSTAEFAAGKVWGSGGVNVYNASYTAGPGDAIKISQPAATLMAGSPAADAQEQAFFAALTKAATFSVSADTLTLKDAQGAVLITFAVLEPVALVGTDWSAVAYNNGKGGLQSLAAGSSITAAFGTDGSLTGKASVNQYTGKYVTGDGGTMTIDPQIVTTKMAGPEALMAQEHAYLTALPKTATYTIEGDELWLRDASGAALAQYVVK